MFEPIIQPIITNYGYQQSFDSVMNWFKEWGIWVVFIAGFSPLSYKLFTLSAGFLSLSFIPFLIASIIGRGARFFLVCGLIKFGGKSAEEKLKKSIYKIGWAFIALAITGYAIAQ